MLKNKSGETPAGWVRNAGRDGEEYGLTTLAKLSEEKIDMFCTVIIGNTSTRFVADKMVTPRGYRI